MRAHRQPVGDGGGHVAQRSAQRPFERCKTGGRELIIEQLGASLVAAEDREPGDLPLKWEGLVIAAVRPAPLHGALDRLIESVEREMGASLPSLSREEKQKAIRLLDDRGAFILRRAVEDVADAMGVSRITVYNYLNALHR